MRDTDIDACLSCSFYIEDYYIPSSAVALLAGLRGVDDESLAMTITLWAMDAANQRCVN